MEEFCTSKPERCLKKNKLKIPQTEFLVAQEKKFPYLFPGDEAFTREFNSPTLPLTLFYRRNM